LELARFIFMVTQGLFCVWSRSDRLGKMANGAFTQSTRVPLELCELDCIIRFPAGSDSVGAVVTRFAIDTPVSF
jgi:hypothetical protein